MKTPGLVLAATIAALVLVGCGSDDGDSEGDAKEEATPEPPILQVAYDACLEELQTSLDELDTADTAEDYLTIESDGTRLTLQTPDSGGDIRSAYALTTAMCVLTNTDGPTAIATKMSQTSALDGERTDSYGDIDISWTYQGGLYSALSVYWVER